ncbi:MAG: beta-lactamase family protein [Streptosporangiaceae bacterium]|nr:beta-lactamase family protein [Streptosporangiaceae bacterium]
MTGFDDVDQLVSDYQRRGGQPGLMYGIVRGGELVHARGLGERWLGGPPPAEDTVFRIASMTKSFTAAAVLLLRDEGALALDDLAENYVPELRGWPQVTADAARISIRHLLTMTAGFPTDDPWGDRQQGLPLDEFAKFLAAGVSFAWAPGTRFEYSNLGYAILGRVITAVTDTEYPDFVRERLLSPLGMTRSRYEPASEGQDAENQYSENRDAEGLARGYRRAPGGWEEVPFDDCGAFAPMGGIFTCVRDLARWVAGFATAFPPGAEGAWHPLCRASRREMQLPQVPTGWDRVTDFPAGGTRSAYGFGLVVEDDQDFGRIAGHGGGYPGFGSHMRWHPATGMGVIALANSTYARMGSLTARILDMLLRQRKSSAAGYSVALAPQPVWPQTLAARAAVDQLLQSWDDAAADRLFSPNVAQDIPYTERRRTISLVRDHLGDFRTDQRATEHDSPAHCRWWLSGERGVVQAQIQLTPERPPRVQSLTLAVPPEPGSVLSDLLGAFVAWLNGGEPVPASDQVDAALLARRVRTAGAWIGPCELDSYAAGDGVTTATARLVGQHASLILSLSVDPVARRLIAAELIG